MLNFLRELVVITSETKDCNGVLDVQKKLADRLSLLGAHIRWIESEKSGYAQSLLASWGPLQKTNGICLLSHADTVYSHAELQPFVVQGPHAFGGGVADNKGGLAIAWRAIEKLHLAGALNNLERPLYFLSSSCEELGSPSLQLFIKKFSQQIEYLFGMEPALPGGALIKKRRGNRYYSLVAHGNSVHTGRDLGHAANPIEGCVRVFELIEKLRIQFPKIGLSLNGIQSAPYKFNMSAEKVEMTIDVRFENNLEVETFHATFIDAVQKIRFHSPDGAESGRIYFELIDDCPAFDCGKNLEADILKLADCYTEAEQNVVTFGDGLGSSDCCYFYRPGLKIVDGLGARGGKIHSPDEFIEVKSLEERASGLAKYLSWLLGT